MMAVRVECVGNVNVLIAKLNARIRRHMNYAKLSPEQQKLQRNYAMSKARTKLIREFTSVYEKLVLDEFKKAGIPVTYYKYVPNPHKEK